MNLLKIIRRIFYEIKKFFIFLIFIVILISKANAEKYEIEIFNILPEQIAVQLTNEFNIQINSDNNKKIIFFEATPEQYNNILKRVEEIDIEPTTTNVTDSQKLEELNNTSVISTPTEPNESIEEKEITEYVFLNYLAAIDMQKIIEDKFGKDLFLMVDKFKNAFIITAQPKVIAEIKKFLKQLDKDYIEAKSEAEALELPQNTEIFKLQYIAPDRMNEIILSHFGKCIISIDNASNALIITDRPSKLAQIGELIKKLDKPEQEQVLEGIQIKYAEINNIFKILQSMYDVKKMDIDDKQKKIYISGPKSKVEEIKKFIEEYDYEPPVILVEGTILSVNIAKAKQLGMKYEHSGGFIFDENAGKFTEEPVVPSDKLTASGRTTGSKVIGEFTAGVALSQVMYQYTSKSGKVQEVSLRALIDNNVAEAVLKPHITFVSGRSGIFEQNQNIPLKSKDANNNPITTIMSVGLTLSVGGIAVPIEITDDHGNKKHTYKIIVSELKLTDGNKEEGEASRETIFEASQIVNDGQLIILGGAINDKSMKKNSKVPLLGDIPIIKHLFTYQDSSKSATEMLALLRLTVMTPESYKYKAAQFTSSKDLRPIEYGGKVNDSIQEHPLKTAEWSSKIIYEENGGYFDLIHDKINADVMTRIDRQFKRNIRGRVKLVQEWSNSELVRKLIFNDKGLKKAFEDMSAEFKLSCFEILLIARHLGSINDEVYLMYYEFLDKNGLMADRDLKKNKKKNKENN
ncbi:MAG TPA: secretin N-terminal domain-containing protein [bacterium]|nr:secretin N-terminal domain-containing protein [bacterium]